MTSRRGSAGRSGARLHREKLVADGGSGLAGQRDPGSPEAGPALRYSADTPPAPCVGLGS